MVNLRDVPLKILVVDDTEATRYAVSRILRKEGYEVFEAGTGREAIECAHQILPDLITLDIHLPDILGFEVCRQIKASAETSRIPVLQISASYVTSKDKIHGLEGGADSYLTHPVEPPVLIATVKALLRFRQLNKTIEKKEEQLRMAVETAQLGLWDRNLETDEIGWSPRANLIFGFDENMSPSVDEVYGRIYPEDRAYVEEVVKSSRDPKSNGDFQIEYRLVWPDGTIRWIACRGKTMFEGEGDRRKAVRSVGSFIDVTERKASEQTMVDARDTAESANRAKTQFLANISHEIRTPIGVIMGMTDIVLGELKSANGENEQTRYLQVVKRNAEVLSKLIDELLDISKVEADRLVVEDIRFELREVLDDVISLLSLKAREKSLDLVVKTVGAVPRFVTTDPTRIRQILINLIGNSIKFTEKGQVQVTVRATEPLVKGGEAELRFEVCDTGLGLDEEQQRKLFQPFSQADASTTRKFGGTGLGLMLSRQLARAVKGDLILAKSDLGKGSTFELSVPAGKFDGEIFELAPTRTVEPKAEKQEAVVANNTGQRLGGMNVLLVEDSPDNQIMIKRFLGMEGASVDLANNGEEGLGRALDGDYDVVLMDIQMPTMDGYEASRRLRENHYGRPVIALTAHALKGERERCLEMGFSDYLTKPLNRANLIGTLEKLKGTASAVPKSNRTLN